MTRIKITGAIAARLACSPLNKQCELHFNKNDYWASAPKRSHCGASYDDSDEYDEPENYTMAIVRTVHSHGNYRWRFANSTLAGKHHIVKQLFEFPPDVTVDEIYLMEGVVDLIGKVIDDILKYRQDDYVAWKKAKKERNEKIIQMRIEEQRQQYEQALEEKQESHQSKGDYLYLMRHRNGLTKIGRSHNPRAREKTLQAEDPFLELIYKAESLGWLEKRFHDMFADDRVRGEWFELPDHRVDWIKYYCDEKIKAMQEDCYEFN